MNIEGWQAGLVLGAAVSLAVDALARMVLHRIRWNRDHRVHKHCEYCNGCLDGDGSGIGAVHKLCYCPLCHDTAITSRADPGKEFLPLDDYFSEDKQFRGDLQ